MKKIQGRLMTDHLSKLADELLHNEVEVIDGIECTCTFVSKQAVLCYGNGENPHRPYLHLSGHISNVSGDFPCDVGYVTLGDNTVDNPGPSASFQLEFNQSELAQLCNKGLFTRAFTCPDIFIDNEFMLPVTCQCKYVKPTSKNDVPLLFIDIKNQHNIQLNAADTGYTLADYFEDVTQLNAEQEDTVDYIGQDFQESVDERETTDFLFDSDTADKKPEKQNDEPQRIVQPKQQKDTDLQSHFENIRREMADKISDNTNEAVRANSAQTVLSSEDFADFNDDSLNEDFDVLQDEVVDEEPQGGIADIKYDRHTVPSHINDIAEKDSMTSDDDEFDKDSDFI